MEGRDDVEEVVEEAHDGDDGKGPGDERGVVEPLLRHGGGGGAVATSVGGGVRGRTRSVSLPNEPQTP